MPQANVEHLAFKTGDAPGILTVRRAGAPRRGRPTRTYLEPARELPVFAETDVLVVGGGPAICAADIGATRIGVNVLLLERYGYLGGLSTGGLVIWIDRMTDWGGAQVIAGFARDIQEIKPLRMADAWDTGSAIQHTDPAPVSVVWIGPRCHRQRPH